MVQGEKVSAPQGVKKGRKFNFPHSYVLLIMIMIVIAISSYIITPGQYARVQDEASGRMVIDPASYQNIEKTPIKPFDLALCIPQGMKEGADVIFMIVLICASFEIINETGVFNTLISLLIKKVRGKESLIIVGITFIFSCVGAFLGWAEGTLVFIPIGLALSEAMGYDALLGLGMVTVAANGGFSGGVLNIYTVGIAQSIAQLPLFSGLWFRVISWLCFTAVTTIFLLWYAKKIKADPTFSPIYGLELGKIETKIDLESDVKFSPRQTLVLIAVIAGFGVCIYGTLNWGWYLQQLSAWFVVLGIVCGFIYGFSANRMAAIFAGGARKIIGGAVVTGLGRAILVTMQKGNVIDTLIHFLATTVEGLPSVLTAVGMFTVQCIINFFIPSGSGQAVTTMPIMAPLSEMVGTTRQVAVLAYQYGDGLTNSIIPTSSVLMAALAIAGGVPWDRWAKFLWRNMVGWILVGGILVSIAHMINLGPF
jgi:uncharacterized ion transporter superfamily protein YfcC